MIKCVVVIKWDEILIYVMILMNFENFGLFEKVEYRRLYIWLYLNEIFKMGIFIKIERELVFRVGGELVLFSLEWRLLYNFVSILKLSKLYSLNVGIV